MLDALLMSRSALQQCNLFSTATTDESRVNSLGNYQDWFATMGLAARVQGGPRRSWREIAPIRHTDRVVASAPYLHKALTEFADIPGIHQPARNMDAALLVSTLKDVLVWATGPRLLVCGMATGHVGWQQAAVQSMVINGRGRADLRPGLAAWLDVADRRMKVSVRYLDYTGWYFQKSGSAAPERVTPK
jgi:hypothetical protein